ncbi:N-acetylated-alpha-linked acidic dipeptidase 2-like [Branchiostoma lanceolatum]|uniref:N-acetylated-alpha-linked acidic dipeptidase 2-like n=1 Tax=Branchiostoma lanceolatum TaxID=7740 RepID=UPI00345346EC
MPGSTTLSMSERSGYSRWAGDIDNIDLQIAPKEPGSEGWFSGRKGLVLRILVLGTLFVFGLILGYVIRRSTHGVPSKVLDSLQQDYSQDISQQLMHKMRPENIETNLRWLTNQSHVGGSSESLAMARQIRQKLRDFGFDATQLKRYKVLLSYPDRTKPNTVSFVEGDNTLFHTTGQQYSDLSLFQPYNAYSPNGTVEGKLVYANYGRMEDFKKLVDKGINCTGRIIIMRYGKIYRGDKVEHAAAAGAIGVVLYSDPADYAINGANDTYNVSWWLPRDGVQTGDIRAGMGDPLTPLYPAIENVARLPESEANLPTIPSQPISYKDAEQFLNMLDGQTAPIDWRGGIKNVNYKLDQTDNNDRYKDEKMKLEVNNKRLTKDIYNVIGTIRGAVEPDRYVIVGNHRDAWTYGAIDPSSGTACFLELARALGQMVQSGWRPRRTIILASWGAEEFGTIGSTEWVEENINELSEKAVAYLNIDAAVNGNQTLWAGASPHLSQVIQEAAKQVPCPHHEGMTVYQQWAKSLPVERRKSDSPPKLDILAGTGSDFAAFVLFAGISSIDLQYTYDQNLNVPFYPVYHTQYETFDYMKRFIDPDFSVHLGTVQVLGETALRLADSFVLPMNCSLYADALSTYVSDLETHYGKRNLHDNLFLGYLKHAVSQFSQASETMQEVIATADRTNPLVVRSHNDKLMQMERHMLNPSGLPGRPQYRHLLFAPSKHDSYSGATFPGLVDAIEDGDWVAAHQQLSIITVTIESAAKNMDDGVIKGQ